MGEGRLTQEWKIYRVVKLEKRRGGRHQSMRTSMTAKSGIKAEKRGKWDPPKSHGKEK